MEMPKPTEAHRKLELLAGIWTGDEKMHPSPWDPEGGTAGARSECRLTLGGFAVVCDYEQRKGGQVSFTGHGVYTYDQNEKCYVLHWFDCMGTGVETFRGDFDGNTLTMTSKSPMGHSRMTYAYSDGGKLTSKMEMSQDGKAWNVFMEGEYTRQD